MAKLYSFKLRLLVYKINYKATIHLIVPLENVKILNMPQAIKRPRIWGFSSSCVGHRKKKKETTAEETGQLNPRQSKSTGYKVAAA